MAPWSLPSQEGEGSPADAACAFASSGRPVKPPFAVEDVVPSEKASGACPSALTAATAAADQLVWPFPATIFPPDPVPGAEKRDARSPAAVSAATTGAAAAADGETGAETSAEAAGGNWPPGVSCASIASPNAFGAAEKLPWVTVGPMNGGLSVVWNVSPPMGPLVQESVVAATGGVTVIWRVVPLLFLLVLCHRHESRTSSSTGRMWYGQSRRRCCRVPLARAWLRSPSKTSLRVREVPWSTGTSMPPPMVHSVSTIIGAPGAEIAPDDKPATCG